VSLKARIQDDMKSALRAGAKERLATIRLILAAIKQREIDERIQLDDAQVLAVLEKMVKQRRESIVQFEAGRRADLVARESAELAVLATYLPEPLSEQELDQLIATTIAATGAASIKDMGRVMSALKPQVQGRADMGALGARIKARLSASA